jgi:hypothetical protein
MTTIRRSRTCSWCHELNPLDPHRPVYCRSCGHRGDVPRAACTFPRCIRPVRPTCACSVALPAGAVGPCGKPARWRLTHPDSLRVLACCDECKAAWERNAEKREFFARAEFAPLAEEVLALPGDIEGIDLLTNHVFDIPNDPAAPENDQ